MSNVVQTRPSSMQLETGDIRTDGGDDIVGILDRGGGCDCPYCGRHFKVVRADDAWSGRPHLTCNRCGYEWESRGKDPTKCPKCGSLAWNRPVTECKCLVCGYEWKSRKPGGPSRCPNCKSNRWDEPPRTVDTTVEEKPTETVKVKWVMDRYEKGQGCVEIASALGLPLFEVMSIAKTALNSEFNPRL